MLTYSQLDFIADCYNPLLLLTSLVMPLWQGRQSYPWWLESAWGLGLVYGLMVLDKTFNLWAFWGLDYSTHTGFALVLVINLCRYHRLWPWLVSLLAYGVLMQYQHYHSWADMLTTALAIGPLFAIGLWLRITIWPTPGSTPSINS